MPLNANLRFWIGLLITFASSILLNAIVLSFYFGSFRTELENAVDEVNEQKAYVRNLVTQQAVAQSERSIQSSAMLTITARMSKHDDALAELAGMRADVTWLKSYLTERPR